MRGRRLAVAAVLASVVVVVLVVLAGPAVLQAGRYVSAFVHGTAVPPRGYDAVPDAELLAAIRAMPEVRSASLGYTTSFENGDSYEGRVHLRPGLSGGAVDSARDRVVLILLHGRYHARIGTVDVVPEDGRVLSADRSDVDVFDATSSTELLGPPAGRRDWPPQLAGIAGRTTSSRPAFCAPRAERNPLCLGRITGLPPRRPGR